MKVQPLETIVAELASDNWLEAGCAIRKLIPHGDAAAVALPALFALTLHDKAPIVSDSCLRIKRLGKHAVAFLRERAINGSSEHRAMAIALLLESGCRWATTTLLVKQLLDARHDDLPEWGTDSKEVITLFRTSLDDECLSVRFNAACALEEFGKHLTDTIPVFIDALRNGTQNQQNWAALHLGRIGPLASAASDALVKAATSECQYTALAASNTLECIRNSEQAS